MILRDRTKIVVFGVFTMALSAIGVFWVIVKSMLVLRWLIYKRALEIK